MSLAKWEEYGWLKSQPTSRAEITGQLRMIERDLKDALVDAISADRRFEAAFNAALSAATLALRACGYRTSSQSGHHVKTIESLELTIQADARLIRRLKGFSNKRNATIYDSPGNVSDEELRSVIRTAVELRREVVAWFHEQRPELESD